MWSSTIPSGGSAARAAAVTAAIAAAPGPSGPGAVPPTGPGAGSSVGCVPCVTLIVVRLPRRRVGSGHPGVGREGEEVGVLVGQRGLDEQRPRLVPAAGRERVASGLLDRLHLLVDQPLDQLAGDLLAVGELDAVVQPLPHLRAGDLGGGGV